MNSGKRLPIFLGITAVLITSSILALDFSTSRDTYIPENLFIPEPIEKITLTKTVEVDRETIFRVMADIENYPRVLPHNIISVTILEQNDSTILAKEKIMEAGIKTTLNVKHTIVPYEKHIVEVLDGDSKGTTITATFEEVENSTKITTDVDFNLHGILAPFAFLATSNINSAMNTAIDTFVTYAIGFEKESEQIVDDIYRELLSRPADPEALHHFGTLIAHGEITPDEFRLMVLESEEYNSLLRPSEFLALEELTHETKKIVIDLYWELLDRAADPPALQFFGSLVQADLMTKEELRQVILDGAEYTWKTAKIVVDLKVEDGLPIKLSWPRPDTPVSLDQFKIYRDGKFHGLINIPKDPFADRDPDRNYFFSDHTIIEGKTYSYHITTVASKFEFDLLNYSDNIYCERDGEIYNCHTESGRLKTGTPPEDIKTWSAGTAESPTCTKYLREIDGEFGVWSTDDELIERYFLRFPERAAPEYSEHCQVE